MTITSISTSNVAAPAPVSNADTTTWQYEQNDIQLAGLLALVDRIQKSSLPLYMIDYYGQFLKIDRNTLDPFYQTLYDDANAHFQSTTGCKSWADLWTSDRVNSIMKNITVDWKGSKDLQTVSDNTMFFTIVLALDAGSYGYRTENFFKDMSSTSTNGGQLTPTWESYSRFMAYYLSQRFFNPYGVGDEKANLILALDDPQFSQTSSPDVYAFFNGTATDQADGLISIFKDVAAIKPGEWDSSSQAKHYGTIYWIETFANTDWLRFITNPS